MTRADSSKYGKKTTEILFSETMEPKEKKKKVGGITCCWMDRGKIAAASPTAEWLLASPRLARLSKLACLARPVHSRFASSQAAANTFRCCFQERNERFLTQLVLDGASTPNLS
jgi:hypothetical protein